MVWLAVLFVCVWNVVMSTSAIFAYWMRPAWGHAVQRNWAKGILWAFGIHIEFRDLHNLPHNGVIAPNHASMFDIMLIASLPRPIRWISKREVAYIPFIGWAMKVMGCYFLRRDRSPYDLRIMKQVEEDLGKEALVAIFPEGTRTRTGELLPLKKGAFKTAQNAGAPICPIGISGSYELAPPGKLPSRRGHKVMIRIGESLLVPAGVPLEAPMDEYLARLKKLLAENERELRS